MNNKDSLQHLDSHQLLRNFAGLVASDRRATATMLVYIAEIDRRKLYLEHAFPSMFAFCTKRFRMSEAIAAKRIRAGRAACSFSCIFGMIARGELHLSGVHQLASHLTEENHEEVLRRAKHKSMREIEELIAEISPKPDAPASIRALPAKQGRCPEETSRERGSSELGTSILAVESGYVSPPSERSSNLGVGSRRTSRTVPLSPRRYKLQVTISREARDKLAALQDLLSHQIPDGDPAEVVERALDALLSDTKKKRAALTDKPRPRQVGSNTKTRTIPAHIRREVFDRDGGRCAFVDAEGRRCESTWQIEFHQVVPYAKGGRHGVDNIELRCRGHNQYEAELAYGGSFMATRRRRARARLDTSVFADDGSRRLDVEPRP